VARILVVDDDDGVRGLLRMILTGVGHQVTEAGDGVEGIEAFRRQPSELVFCDLFMPNKEGLETIRELIRERADVPVIAMSGGGFAGTVNLLPAARAFGAARLLPKPFDRNAVLAALADTLRPAPAR
jgi:CheY-like chemotaxis protein